MLLYLMVYMDLYGFPNFDTYIYTIVYTMSPSSLRLRAFERSIFSKFMERNWNNCEKIYNIQYRIHCFREFTLSREFPPFILEFIFIKCNFLEFLRYELEQTRDREQYIVLQYIAIYIAIYYIVRGG